MRYLLLVAVLSLGCQQPPDHLGGQGTDQPDPPDPDPQPRTAEVNFASSRAEAEAGTFKENFTLLGQRDIFVAIDFPIGDEPEVVYMELLNPNGMKQRSLWRAFAPNATPDMKAIHPELGGEMPVQSILVDDEGFGRAVLMIPIAGTKFTKYRLTGDFKVRAYMPAHGTQAIAEDILHLAKE